MKNLLNFLKNINIRFSAKSNFIRKPKIIIAVCTGVCLVIIVLAFIFGTISIDDVKELWEAISK